MKIRKIYACWVYVSDMAQSVRFYQDIGFTVKFVEKDGAWVEFDLGETSFALLQRPEEKGKVQPRKTRIMFEVARIEEMQEHLISLGVKRIGSIRKEPYGKLLTFEDPDGHWLEFFEPHPQKPKTQYPTPNT
ncbi:VOC family protein [Tannerella forsythia]|uniref:Glyoxalase family protein n=1 Tax=Tannerella forsythia (strain ATCC 43037 / JCM 10827 / CCUG 21028 A / KCTC 5666 / FDC 338) TaxID=203275 RepID=G8UM63_TANFA|nr:VOC family protein [Tannerella forsythia]AEW22617.1 glyoxalase family protein [Tannerella forsythia 92A2]SCQ22281.1 fosfomycin resistance protein FosB [Tannerella forsythia]